MINHNSIKLKGLEGFEKAIAACHMLGELDYHAGNLMVKDGKILKIDHGKSFMQFHRDLSSMVKATHEMFDLVRYSQAIKNGNLSFSAKEYSAALAQMTKQLSDDQIDAIVSQKVDELKKAGFNPKGIIDQIVIQNDGVETHINPSNKVKGGIVERKEALIATGKFPKVQVDDFDRLADVYTDLIKKNRDNMAKIARDVEIISKFDVNDRFKNGGWIEAFATSPIKDPIHYAKHNNLTMEGKDPIAWAIEHEQKIDDKDPLEWAINNKQKIYGSDPLIWAEESAKKELENLTNEFAKTMTEALLNGKQQNVDSTEFHNNMLKILKNHGYLNGEAVEQIKNHAKYKSDIESANGFLNMQTPTIGLRDKLTYTVGKFCDKLGLSSLAKHFKNKAINKNIGAAKNAIDKSLNIRKALVESKSYQDTRKIAEEMKPKKQAIQDNSSVSR